MGHRCGIPMAAAPVPAGCRAAPDIQQWRLEYVGDGFYQLCVLHTDMCLDVAYRGDDDGADVVQATCADPSLATSYNTGSGDVVQWTCGDSSKWWQQWS